VSEQPQPFVPGHLVARQIEVILLQRLDGLQRLGVGAGEAVEGVGGLGKGVAAPSEARRIFYEGRANEPTKRIEWNRVE